MEKGYSPEEMLDEALKVKKARGFKKKNIFYGITAAACVIVKSRRSIL